MIMQAKNVAPFYDGWRFAQERLVERIGELSPEELALRAAPHLWPIWAIAAHTAGVRPYWLCHIFKEPGADRTPFNDPDGEGWEATLPTHVRQASSSSLSNRPGRSSRIVSSDGRRRCSRTSSAE